MSGGSQTVHEHKHTHTNVANILFKTIIRIVQVSYTQVKGSCCGSCIFIVGSTLLKIFPCANDAGLDLYIKEKQERQLLAVCGSAMNGLTIL